MERIKLSKKEKVILQLMRDAKYPAKVNQEDEISMKKLIYVGLVSCKQTEFGNLLVPNLTEKGEVYIAENPNLRNPHFYQDKSLVVSIIALVVSIAGTLFQIISNICNL